MRQTIQYICGKVNLSFDSYFKAVLQEIEPIVKTIKLEKQS